MFFFCVALRAGFNCFHAFGEPLVTGRREAREGEALTRAEASRGPPRDEDGREVARSLAPPSVL